MAASQADAVDGGVDSQDLLLVAFPGVQAFISEARRTGDLHGASRIVATLVGVAARTIVARGGRPVFPAALCDDAGQPGEEEQAELVLRYGAPSNRIASFVAM